MLSIRSRLILLTLPLSALTAALGCPKADVSPGPTALCFAEVAREAADAPVAASLTPRTWLSLLAPGYEQANSTRGPKDCGGRPLTSDSAQPSEAPVCSTAHEPSPALPPRELADDDLILTPIDDVQQIVWITAQHFEDGRAAGPVAVAEWTTKGVAIHSVGHLDTHAKGARLSLEKLADDESMLVVQSQVCDAKQPTQCREFVKLAPRIDDRFVDLPLRTEEGRCLGGTQFLLADRREVRVHAGQTRRFELTRSLSFGSGQPRIVERVVISEVDPNQPDQPPQIFRTLSSERALTRRGDGYVIEASVWDQVLEQHGSVHPSQAKNPNTEQNGASQSYP